MPANPYFSPSGAYAAEAATRSLSDSLPLGQ